MAAGSRVLLSSRSGFTLVELMAVVVITAIMSLVAVGVFVNAQVRGNRVRSVSQLNQQGSFLLDRMNFAIRSASGVQTCDLDMESLSLDTYEGDIILLQLTGDQISSNSSVLSDPNVQVESLSFDCTQGTDQTGAFIQYAFTLSIGDPVTNPDSYFTQDFESQVSIRSY